MALEIITIESPDGGTIMIERIDICSVEARSEVGTKQDFFEYAVPEMINEAKNKYGEHRPIQIKEPTIDDQFDYSVFLELTRIFYSKEKQEVRIFNLGLLFFCSIDQLDLNYMKKVSLSMPNWSTAKSFTTEEY